MLGSWRPVLLTFALLYLLSPAESSFAHPLGNDNIEHISILWVLPDRVEFDLFLDFAEGPSKSFPEQIDANGDGEEGLGEQRDWLKKKSLEVAPHLRITINGQAIPATLPDETRDPNSGRPVPSIPGVIKIPGTFGLPTYRALIRYVASYPQPLGDGEHVLHFRDESFKDFNGLKRVLLEQVPSIEVLAPHPDFLDAAGTPFLYDQYDPSNLPQEREATVRFRVKEARGGEADKEPGGQGDKQNAAASAPASDPESEIHNPESELPYPILDPRNDPAQLSTASRQARHLVGLLQGRWNLTILLTVTVLAFGWGAAHALMPGHAKTVVAAYLISQRGNYWHAVALAVIVTLTHTALVVVVGLVILFYQKSHPALGPTLQLWLGILAGVLVAGMGITLVWRALSGRIAHHHYHDHGHAHDERSWLRRLFTHSHPHVPGPAHHHHHHHHHEEGRGPRAEGSAMMDSGLRIEEGAAGLAERSTGASPVGLCGATGTQGEERPSGPNEHTHEHDVQAQSYTHAHDHGHSDRHAHTHTHDHEHPHEHLHGHEHSHSHDDVHSHAHAHLHEHAHAHSSIRNPQSAIDRPLTLRMLLLLGITGGIVPCPTATIILLLGISANVVAGALYAVGVFSLGLALTLMLIGFAALFSRRFAARVLSDAQHEGRLSTTGQRLLLQAVPAASGALVTLLGAAIAANYLHYLLRGSALFKWLG